MSVKTGYAQGQFSWVDLISHDMAASKEFYGQLFGWTSTDMDTQGGPPYAQFELGGKSVGGMGQMSDEMKSQGVPPMWNCYVNVDDVEAIVSKAGQLGATVTMPAMKVLDAGSMAIVQDPTGAHVSLWQKDRHFGAELVNDPGAFCWNELVTRDVEKAKAFYGSLLGWEFEDNPGTPTPYFIIQNQGSMNGGIMQMDDAWGEMPPCWTVYFTVEDIDASVAKLQSLGGKVMAPAFDVPVGRMAVVTDAQGAAFNLIALNVAPD